MIVSALYKDTHASERGRDGYKGEEMHTFSSSSFSHKDVFVGRRLFASERDFGLV